MRLVRSCLLLASTVLLLAACFGGLGGNHKPTMGPDGAPIFVGQDFRHPAGEPFWCFAHVTPSGDQVSSCREIKEWCASQLREVQAEGLAIVGGCEARETATCLTFYRGDASKTACYATERDCGVAYAAFIDPSYGARRDQLTACTTIDIKFQPPA